MLKLYGGTRSRASITRWYLEELQAPYEFVILEMNSGAHLKPEYLAINPMGKVPALADGEFKVWESGATLLYLADKHQQLPTTPEGRAEVYQWVLFANSTLAQLFGQLKPEEMTRLITPLNQRLEQHQFMMGAEFGVVDVAVGAVLAYMPIMLNVNFDDFPAVADYVQRLTQRPAYQKAISGQP